jgi:hypothetical protein
MKYMRRLLESVLVQLLLLGCAIASEQQTTPGVLVIDAYSVTVPSDVIREKDFTTWVTANIALDEDTSINAAPKELQEEYELALVSGDEERLEGVLTELWEEYGIHAENPPVRETSGIKRLAIMHDDGVNAFGFKQPDILLEWMIVNGFPVRDVNLALYD